LGRKRLSPKEKGKEKGLEERKKTVVTP